MRSMANVDGVITPVEAAKISVMDRGFLYGDSIYEVFRTYDGVPYLYKEHMDRLDNSARLSQMRVSQTREFLTGEIKRTALAGGAARGQDVFVRLTITRGSGPFDLDPNKATQTSYVIVVKDTPAWNQKFYDEGVKLAIPTVRRNPTHALDPNIKGGNYLNNVLAVGEAVQLGADDALMCNMDGFVTEASNSNILFVVDGNVITPDAASGNLNGTTKNIVAKVCRDAGIPFEHTKVRIDDVREAAEAFIASATREVMPVKSIRLPDGQTLQYPAGGGATTKKLQAMYKDFVKHYVNEHRAEAFF